MRNFADAYNQYPSVREPVRKVMASFGKAMWHFAQLKEILWYEAGFEHAKEFFHYMEHSYGEHIDNFKALLAQEGLPLIYPNIQGMEMESKSLEECFDTGIALVDEVNSALSEFIYVTDNEWHEPLARQAEEIQVNNYKPKAIMIQARTMAGNAGSATSFDNWFEYMVGDYYG